MEIKDFLDLSEEAAVAISPFLPHFGGLERTSVHEGQAKLHGSINALIRDFNSQHAGVVVDLSGVFALCEDQAKGHKYFINEQKLALAILEYHLSPDVAVISLVHATLLVAEKDALDIQEKRAALTRYFASRNGMYDFKHCIQRAIESPSIARKLRLAKSGELAARSA